MNLLKNAAHKGFNLLQELDEPGGGGDRMPSRGSAGADAFGQDPDTSSLWASAAGFGRQLMQELNPSSVSEAEHHHLDDPGTLKDRPLDEPRDREAIDQGRKDAEKDEEEERVGRRAERRKQGEEEAEEEDNKEEQKEGKEEENEEKADKHRAQGEWEPEKQKERGEQAEESQVTAMNIDGRPSVPQRETPTRGTVVGHQPTEEHYIGDGDSDNAEAEGQEGLLHGSDESHNRMSGSPSFDWIAAEDDEVIELAPSTVAERREKDEDTTVATAAVAATTTTTTTTTATEAAAAATTPTAAAAISTEAEPAPASTSTTTPKRDDQQQQQHMQKQQRQQQTQQEQVSGEDTLPELQRLREALVSAQFQVASEREARELAEERLKRELAQTLDDCSEEDLPSRLRVLERLVRTLEGEMAAKDEKLESARKVERRLREENKDMEKELFSAQDRWREQIRRSETTAERAESKVALANKESAQKLQSLEAEVARLEAALAESRSAESRLRQENVDMEQELHEAQQAWRKQILKAETAAAAATEKNAELDGKLKELTTQHEGAQSGVQTIQRKADQEQAALRQETARLMEELRTTAAIQSELESELSTAQQARHSLEEQLSSLNQQLEQAQNAYAQSAQEFATMSARLDELEYGSEAKATAEELVRTEISTLRGRIVELERELGEVKWLRDYARQEAEEARRQLQQLKEEAAEQQASSLPDSAAAPPASPPDALTASSSSSLPEVTATSLDTLRKSHAEELKQASAAHREELDYLRKRCDEKDRRLETLICERNAMKLEIAEGQASSSGNHPGKSRKDPEHIDLEEGLALRTPFKSGEGIGGAAAECARDGDVVLRRFSRILFVSRTMRGVFFVYLLLLHIWIWVILHHTASSRTSGTHG